MKKKTILTKRIVFKRLRRLPLISSVFLGIVVSCMVVLIARESIFNGLLMGFFIGVIAFLVFLIGAIPHMLRLNRQEKVMGFDFDEEMRKSNIRKENYINTHWFISEGVVIRRGYVKKIEKITYVASMYAKSGQKTEARIRFRTIDNKTRVITLGTHVSSKFESWVKGEKGVYLR